MLRVWRNREDVIARYVRLEFITGGKPEYEIEIRRVSEPGSRVFTVRIKNRFGIDIQKRGQIQD
jgi:hypothetical protein